MRIEIDSDFDRGGWFLRYVGDEELPFLTYFVGGYASRSDAERSIPGYRKAIQAALDARAAQLTALASRCWGGSNDAWMEISERVDLADGVPSIIRALALTAPEGALSYIGVWVLEDISMRADREDRPDTSIDDLLSARLDAPVSFEILSGVAPGILEKWQARERLAELFTSAQLDALYDWPTRVHHRIVIDGASTRLLPESEWLASS